MPEKEIGLNIGVFHLLEVNKCSTNVRQQRTFHSNRKKKCHGQKNESLKPIPFNILYKIKCVDAQIYPSMDPSVRINDTLKLDHIDTQFSKLPKQAQD